MERAYEIKGEDLKESFNEELLKVIPRKLLYETKSSYLKQDDSMPSAPYG